MAITNSSREVIALIQWIMYVVNVGVYVPFNCDETVHFAVSLVGCACVTASPLMELPPLSPGIQDNVIDVVVVFVTVRRGWSGGTVDVRTNKEVIAWLVFVLY